MIILILANPPFDVSDWGGKRPRDNKRWQDGAPPAGNANYAWVQHCVHRRAGSHISRGLVTRGLGVV